MLYVWLFKLTAYLPLTLFYRIRIIGKENKPKGKCIFALNHSSAMDGTLINVVFPLRRIYFLTTRKLFNCSKIHQWQLWQMGCRPSLSPSEDMETMMNIAGSMKKKEMIGFFSEGKIHHSVGNFMGGAVILALKTKLPLVPVYIKTAPFYKGGTQISFGEPIELEMKEYPTAEDIAELNDILRSKVIKLSVNKGGKKNELQ